MVAQFACSSYLWSIGTSSLSCEWKLYKLINFTIYYTNSNNLEWRAEYLTFITRVTIASFSYFFYLTCNTFLCLDLYLMLKEPFKSKESRMKWYYLISICVGLASVIFIRINQQFYSFFSILIMGTYLISSLYVTCYTIRRLKRSGLS